MLGKWQHRPVGQRPAVPCRDPGGGGGCVRRSSRGGRQRAYVAVRIGGAVVCWGSADRGKLGDGSGVDATTPVTVAGLTDAVAVSASAYHTCAVRTTGQVVCWGWGSNGQLGDGLGVDAATPVAGGGRADRRRRRVGGRVPYLRGPNDRRGCVLGLRWFRRARGRPGDR